MKEIKVNLKDLSHRMYSEHGVIFETCSVGGHDTHGKVERTIKSIQEGLEDLGLSKMRLPAIWGSRLFVSKLKTAIITCHWDSGMIVVQITHQS